MPRVFITNHTGLDFSKAAVYGDLVPVIQGPANIFRPELVKERVEEVLKDFNFAEDALLVSGSSLVAGFAFLCLSFLAAGKPLDENPVVKLVLFDSKKFCYFTRTVRLD